MKIRFGIYLKVILAIILISIILVFTLINAFHLEAERFANKTINKDGFLLSSFLDDKIEDFFNKHDILKQNINQSDNSSYLDDFPDFIVVHKENLTEEFTKLINEVSEIFIDVIDIKKFNIVLPDENYVLKIFASSNETLVGQRPEYYNYCIYSLVHNAAIISRLGDTYESVIISPLTYKEKNWCIGAYEITLSSEQSMSELNRTISYLSFISFFITIILVLIIIYFMRKILVKPILTFADKAKLVGKGKLDVKVDISSKDELGDLADAFNQMAKDLKKSREKIEDYNKILEKLLDQKDEFIGQLGHDLKNPLQPLVGLLPMLIEQEKDSSIKEALEIMNKNVEYMQNLIFKTLQLAKLRSPNIKFDFEHVTLREEVDEVVNSQKILLEENNSKVINLISGDLFVKADKLRLAEVFKNLIANAVKYKQKEKEGIITFDAKLEGKFVVVSVSDNGQGMKKEQLMRIFDEFYKADRFSSEERSSGLGLSICKKIVEKHGGRIWVDSPGLNKGTTFYLSLKAVAGGDVKGDR